MWRVWRSAHRAKTAGLCDGAVGTVAIASRWDAHRKGIRTLSVGVTDATPSGFEASKSAAAWVTATNVSAAVGLERGRIAAVMNGGIGMALVKNAGVMLASLTASNSAAVVTFLSLFQLGTSTSLVVRTDFGLNLREMACGVDDGAASEVNVTEYHHRVVHWGPKKESA